MQIKLHNLAAGVLVVSGPTVEFSLDDTGKASTAIHVSLSDGTHFNFPDGSAKGTVQTTRLPPGDYTVVVLVAAFSHANVFGRTYKSAISISGVVVATADGTLPKASDGENDFQAFVLRVQ